MLVKDLFSLPPQHLPGQSFMPRYSMPGCYPLCSPCWQPERNPTTSTMTLSKLQGSSTLGYLEELCPQEQGGGRQLGQSCTCPADAAARSDLSHSASLSPPSPWLPHCQTPQPEVTDAVSAAPRKAPSCCQGDSTWALHLGSNEPEHTSVRPLSSICPAVKWV